MKISWKTRLYVSALNTLNCIVGYSSIGFFVFWPSVFTLLLTIVILSGSFIAMLLLDPRRYVKPSLQGSN